MDARQARHACPGREQADRYSYHSVAVRLDRASDLQENGDIADKSSGSVGEAEPGPAAAGRPPSSRKWLKVLASAFIAAVVVAALAVAVVEGMKPAVVAVGVSADPPPVLNMSVAHIFAPPTDGLISDPYVLPTPRLDYMYSSGVGGVGQPNIPLRTFRVMGRFLSFTDAVPEAPSWVVPDSGLWAPDVRKVGKVYVMWFSGRYRYSLLASGAHPKCIGVATSASPTGPFVSHSSRPAICQVSLYGDIDPRTFIGPHGQEWLYWKSDGNAVTTDVITTNIFAQRLSSNGQSLIGTPKVILTNGLNWEGWLVESPDMVRHGDRYLLFFSGNSSDVEDNGIGLALCKGPDGPCTSPYRGPWLGSNVQGAGPGEETIYVQNGITWMLYTPHSIYYPGAYPGLAAARVAFTSKGMPYVASRQGMVPGVAAGAYGKPG